MHVLVVVFNSINQTFVLTNQRTKQHASFLSRLHCHAIYVVFVFHVLSNESEAQASTPTVICVLHLENPCQPWCAAAFPKSARF